MRPLVVILFLLLVVGGIAWYAIVVRGGADLPKDDGKIREAQVAAVDLPANGVITPSVLMTARNEDGFPGGVTTQPTELEGAILKEPVKSGQPILKGNILARVRRQRLMAGESNGRMVVIPNVSTTSSVPLVTGTKLQAIVDLEGARLAAEGSGGAEKPPIVMTVLFASNPRVAGLELVEKGKDWPGTGGRDLLVYASPRDAIRIGQAVRDNTLSYKPLAATSRTGKTGTALEAIRARTGISVNDINPLQREKEQMAIGMIDSLINPNRDEGAPPPPKATIVFPPAPRGHWKIVDVPVDREIEVYKGKEMTRMKVPEGMRRERVWVPSEAIAPLPPATAQRPSM